MALLNKDFTLYIFRQLSRNIFQSYFQSIPVNDRIKSFFFNIFIYFSFIAEY